MLEVFRSTESLYSYPQILELSEKKYLNKNFTNAFTASVIFLMSHWIKPKPGLTYVHVVLLYKVFKSLSSDEHPRHIYWYGSPTPSSSHIGWKESKINKSDTRLVIFVSTFFKRQKLRLFFKFPNSLSRLTFLCYSSCTQACNIPHVLSKNQEICYSWENLISDGTFATPRRGERWVARLAQGQKAGHKTPDFFQCYRLTCELLK